MGCRAQGRVRSACGLATATHCQHKTSRKVLLGSGKQARAPYGFKLNRQTVVCSSLLRQLIVSGPAMSGYLRRLPMFFAKCTATVNTVVIRNLQAAGGCAVAGTPLGRSGRRPASHAGADGRRGKVGHPATTCTPSCSTVVGLIRIDTEQQHTEQHVVHGNARALDCVERDEQMSHRGDIHVVKYSFGQVSVNTLHL